VVGVVVVVVGVFVVVVADGCDNIGVATVVDVVSVPTRLCMLLLLMFVLCNCC